MNKRPLLKDHFKLKQCIVGVVDNLDTRGSNAMGII